MSSVAVHPLSIPHSRSPSPCSSLPLLETREETRLVLEAFLRQSLTVPLAQRPGRVGGAYKDHSKFSVGGRESRKRVEDGWDSLDEQISAAEEKKHGIKDLIKKRLRRHSTKTRSLKKDASKAESVHSHQKDGSLDVDSTPGQSKLEVAVCSSDEEGGKIEDKKKKKKKSPFSTLIRKLKAKKEEPENPDLEPKRPGSLPLRPEAEPEMTAVSPTHPPEFYEEVAETLVKIAQKQVPVKLSPVGPPTPTTESNEKEIVVNQLVQVLSMQGDAINNKIESDPFLRSSLARLSYPSFAKLLDTFANQTEAPVPAPASPTLSRVAVTMEVSRRVITATGTQRMRGFAEQYMQNFAPWVQRQGGWEKIVQLEDVSEYD
ncbi:apoptosis facilitator Bcl-2-like protein 14 [Megalops cyprinoides]|uniref:apoptosis facilitator Bcl-2-like protein 14 n=1 Tax=Megalops cyprinoides TaxID=118141 RepID=UPI00186452E6|nr:apoptosis facilitator Bcl-2-like protein 14 [Megalops cyprinoides]